MIAGEGGHARGWRHRAFLGPDGGGVDDAGEHFYGPGGASIVCGCGRGRVHTLQRLRGDMPMAARE